LKITGVTRKVKIAMPDVRVALNAGLAHVEFLKDADGVAAEKARSGATDGQRRIGPPILLA